MNRIDQRLQKSELEFIRNCENLEKLTRSVTNSHTPMEIGELENEDSSTIITTLSFRVFLLLVLFSSSLSNMSKLRPYLTTIRDSLVQFMHQFRVLALSCTDE